jgi:rubrerythrin
MTPSADMHATLNKGVLEVLVDPRTKFAQCLEAILVTELVDNDGWEALTTLAEQAGQRELATRFQRAHAEEVGHLLNVRRWLAIAQGRVEP